MPTTALTRFDRFDRFGAQRVLRQHMAILAQYRLGQAGEGLAHDQVAEGRGIFEHPHHADAFNLASCLVVHCRVGPLALHRIT